MLVIESAVWLPWPEVLASCICSTGASASIPYAERATRTNMNFGCSGDILAKKTCLHLLCILLFLLFPRTKLLVLSLMPESPEDTGAATEVVPYA